MMTVKIIITVVNLIMAFFVFSAIADKVLMDGNKIFAGVLAFGLVSSTILMYLK